MKAAIQYDMLHRSYEIGLWVENGDGSVTPYILELKRSDKKINDLMPIPTTRLQKPVGDQFFHALQLALSAVGISPKIETATDGELKATKVHLADMQKLMYFQLDSARKQQS